MTHQLCCPIATQALIHPHEIAIEEGEEKISYHRLECLVQSIERYILSIPISSKRLGLLSYATTPTLLFYFAAIRRGFSVCLLNPKEPPQALQHKIASLALDGLWSAFPTPLPNTTIIPSYQNIASTSYEPLIPYDHTCSYLYTSGSSAAPKIACLSFQNHYYSALGMLTALDLQCRDRYLLSLPLHHVSGLSIPFRCFLSGATLVIATVNEALPAALFKKRLSHLSLVYTQYVRLLQACPLTSHHLKSILLGGSFFSQQSLEQGMSYQLPLYLSYGLTEMSSTVSCNPLLQTCSPSHLGQILPYRNLIINPDGEILLSGQTLFQGYFCLQTQQILRYHTRFATNDLGCLQDNFLILHGRKDRLIISGGENIQPEEIEQCLLSINSIEYALVLSLPDPMFGEALIAVLHTTSTLNEQLIQHHLSLQLPRYKIPKRYLSWPLHLLPSGSKIPRSLREALTYHILNLAAIERVQ